MGAPLKTKLWTYTSFPWPLAVLWYMVLMQAAPSVNGTSVFQKNRSARFYRRQYMDDKIITAHNTTIVDVRLDTVSKSECAAACLAVESCGSFFYVSGEGLCQMHSILFLAEDEAVDKPGATYWQLTQDACPYKDGFVLYRPLKLCYQYHDNSVFWDDARDTCAAQGTSLLQVDSEDKFQHMYQFLRGSSVTRRKHVSIGAREIAGTWKWPDGSDVTWFKWAQNEPSSAAETCMAMAWFFYFDWNDVPCNTDTQALYNFICQKTI